MSGDILVIWQGDSLFGAGTATGQWFHSSGVPATSVFNAQIPLIDDSVAEPLADGRIAIRVRGQWSYAFTPGATAPEEAPCWLQQRPNTEVFLTHGNTIHALLPSEWHAQACDQALEVLDPLGRSCGKFALGMTTEHCDVTSATIGADGTVLELGPEIVEQMPTYELDYCNERWWPGLLR